MLWKLTIHILTILVTEFYLKDLSDLSWINLFIFPDRKSDELSEDLLNLWVQQEGRVGTKTTEYQAPGTKTRKLSTEHRATL